MDKIFYQRTRSCRPRKSNFPRGWIRIIIAHAGSWNPTLVLSLEYKAKIPHDPAFSQRTVGLYSYNGFLHEGKQDVYVEVWTSPSEIGQGIEESDWREKQVCLAIAHQMAVTVPLSVSAQQVSLANGKL